MVRRIRAAFAEDGFLGVVHLLLLMDDTVLLATSREMALAKLRVTIAWCKEHGMGVNLKKTKFMAIGATAEDKVPLVVDDIIVKYSSTYLYLGAWMTDSGKMDDVLALHAEHCTNIVNKFSIFCCANTMMPFTVKKTVFDAAVVSAITYSSETWLTNNI